MVDCTAWGNGLVVGGNPQVDRVKDTGPISESFTTEGLMSVVYVPLVNSNTTT